LNAKRKEVYADRVRAARGVEDRERWACMQLDGDAELDRCSEAIVGAGAEGYAAASSLMNSAVRPVLRAAREVMEALETGVVRSPR
jgi:hypothetical protein